jgi:hypothetical protein
MIEELCSIPLGSRVIVKKRNRMASKWSYDHLVGVEGKVMGFEQNNRLLSSVELEPFNSEVIYVHYPDIDGYHSPKELDCDQEKCWAIYGPDLQPLTSDNAGFVEELPYLDEYQ